MGDGPYNVHQEYHIGRAWRGHGPEDTCPCPQEACGLIAEGKVDPKCGQHAAFQTIRQGHPAALCPARNKDDDSQASAATSDD